MIENETRAYLRYLFTTQWPLAFYLLEVYQHPRWHYDGCTFVAVRTHNEFIVLHNWETTQVIPWLDISLTHIILILSKTRPCHILLKLVPIRCNGRYQFCKATVLFGSGLNPQPATCEAIHRFGWLGHLTSEGRRTIYWIWFTNT